MRYGKTENTVLLGKLPTQSTVTIKIIDLSDDSLLTLTDNTCTESIHIAGLYNFDLETNVTLPNTYKNYGYEMTDGTSTFYGKFVYGDTKSDIQSVKGTDVVSVDDFKADSSIVNVTSIVQGLLETDLDVYTATNTIGSTLKRIERIEAFVWVDTDLLVNGDGTQHNPFNNINDAKDLVESSGINNIKLSGNISLTHNLKNMNIFGIGSPNINLNSQDIKNTRFNGVKLEGSYTGSIIAKECTLKDGLLLNGYFLSCALDGTLNCGDSSFILMVNCHSNIPGLNRPYISLNSGTANKLAVRNYSGGLTLLNSDDDNDKCTIEVAQGSLTIDSSCMAGTIVARGGCKFVDESNGATVIDETYSRENITSSVWEAKETVTLETTEYNKLMSLVNYDDTNINNKLDNLDNNISNINTEIQLLPTNVWGYSTREITNSSGSGTFVATEFPNILVSDYWNISTLNQVSVKINENPTSIVYSFQLHYRMAGDGLFTDSGVILTLSENDVYVNEYSFDISGSYMLKFVEVQNRIQPLYTSITVVEFDIEQQDNWSITV